MLPSMTASPFTQNPRESDRSPIFANWFPFSISIGDGTTGVFTKFEFLDSTDFQFLDGSDFDFLV